ncbi:hypothetical protein HYX09_00535 [Candidatus Woesearchaeota archaeon]|nr:hypothetical protein [Candidatus Woesearchaeota archaeon]MBI2660735.1 hypothetical protein [Candidatus Woesearchaeota archaeon]
MAKQKIKPILPSLREKKRYLAFEVISKNRVNFDSLQKAIYSTALKVLGQLGVAKAGIIVLKDKWQNNRGLIRVSHRNVDNLRTALMFVDKVDNEEVIVRSVGLSGILRKAENKYLMTH